MNVIKLTVICGIWLLLQASQSIADEFPPGVKDIVPQVQLWAKNPQLIQAIKNKNRQSESLRDIKSIDKKWRSGQLSLSVINKLLNNQAAKTLQKMERTQPYFIELFVMDNQGAIVAMTHRTTDYWQGDEDKFIASFNAGPGAVHISDVNFDKSTQRFLTQVSVPILDNKQVIGALTVGINLDIHLLNDSTKTDKKTLSRQQKQWLKTHSKITLGMPLHYEPSVIQDKNGKLSGIYIDLLHALNDVLGTHIQIKIAPWPELLTLAEQGLIDGVFGTVNTFTNEQNFLSSTPYAYANAAIFARNDASFMLNQWDDIKDLRIIYVNKRKNSMQLLEKFKSSNITAVDTIFTGMTFLLEGKADVFVGMTIDNYLINKHQLAGIGIAYINPVFMPFGISVRKDWPELIDILNTGIDAVGEEHVYAVISKWLNINNNIELLSPKERQWLVDHKDIKLAATTGFEPFLIVDKNQSQSGIYIDIMHAINQVLGSNIAIQIQPLSDMDAAIKNGSAAGAIGITVAGAKVRNLQLSATIFNASSAIFKRRDASFSIDSLEDLHGKRILTLNNRIFTEEIIIPFKSTSEIIYVASVKQAFNYLLAKKADLFVGASVDNYYLKQHVIDDISLAYIADNNISFSFGIAPEKTELLAILNKAISAIGTKRFNAISAAWINPKKHERAPLFTQQEKQWLAQHKEITLGFTTGYPPWLLQEPSGNLIGILPELAQAISQVSHLEVKMKTLPWHEMQQLAKDKKVHGLISGTHYVYKKNQLIPSQPYSSIQLVVYALAEKAIQIDDLNDLKNYRVSYSGDVIEDILTAPVPPNASMTQLASSQEGFFALLKDTADVYVGFSSDRYIIMRDQLIGVKAIFLDSKYRQPLSIGIRDDMPILLSIINKSLQAIGQKGIDKIVGRWVGTPNKKLLNAQEKQWLSTLPPLKVAIFKDRSPFEYIDDDGQLAGINKDYLRLLSERLGIELQPLLISQANITLTEFLSQDFDIALILPQHLVAGTDLLYSRSYMDIPYVVATLRDENIMHNIDELKGKIVAVVHSSYINSMLKKHYPEIQILQTRSLKGALLAVSKKQATALIGNRVSIEYMQRKLDIDNLKISLITDYQYKPVITVRKNLSPLIPILNKVLADISNEEKKLIFDKWVNQPFIKQMNWKALLIWVAVLTGVVAVFFLFQQRKLHRRQLKAIAAFESSIKLKNDFLMAISHELRTPMNAIFAGLELLHSEIQNSMPGSLNIVQGGANDMMRLVNDILAYTEVQSNQCRVNAETLSLAHLLQSLKDKYQPLCEEKNLQLDWQIDPDIPPWLELDEEKVLTVLEKLLENALQFTDKGCIDFLVKYQNIPAQAQLLITVKDSGIGIAEENKKQIFEAFKQTESGFKRRYSGLGIGLAICQQLIKTMGGEISLQSTVGKGSCFSLTIPAILGQTPTEESPANLASADLPILIVEDNKVNQILMQKMVEKLGYSSLTANHGEEALEILDQHKISLILMDLQMPVMDGFSCTEAIRARQDSTHSIPIIAVTANLMDADKEHCTLSGMNDFIKKPVHMDVLSNSLSRYVEPA